VARGFLCFYAERIFRIKTRLGGFTPLSLKYKQGLAWNPGRARPGNSNFSLDLLQLAETEADKMDEQ
jgi:hypothetical protein